MIIRINDTPVDFTLEHETTFADLHHALEQWAQKEQFELLSVLGNGMALRPDDATALNSLEVIEVEAVPAASGAMARLGVISHFFTLVAQTPSAELREQYHGFKDVLPTLLSPVAHRLTEEFAALETWAEPGLSAAARSVAAVAAALHKGLMDPQTALRDALDRLENALPGEELAQQFQKGQDKDGFGRILMLFTAFEDLSRSAELALDGPGADASAWTEFQDGLRPFLSEARDALDAGDQILLTDLLEYEIVPRLSGVRSCFPNLDPAGRQP